MKLGNAGVNGGGVRWTHVRMAAQLLETSTLFHSNLVDAASKLMLLSFFSVSVAQVSFFVRIPIC